MRRYWSVILLGTRGVTGKLLALLAALAAAEAALLLATGGFSGMILPASSESDVISANPAKWVESSDGAGLYAPRLGGWFMRNWTPGQTDLDRGRAAGTSQAASQIASRNTFQAVVGGNYYGGTDVWNREDDTPVSVSNGFGVNSNYSGSYPIESVKQGVRPANLAQPVCIYMGNPAA